MSECWNRLALFLGKLVNFLHRGSSCSPSYLSESRKGYHTTVVRGAFLLHQLSKTVARFSYPMANSLHQIQVTVRLGRVGKKLY